MRKPQANEALSLVGSGLLVLIAVSVGPLLSAAHLTVQSGRKRPARDTDVAHTLPNEVPQSGHPCQHRSYALNECLRSLMARFR